MDVSEIVDQKSFEAWLGALPKERRRESAVALATRAALRAFPYWAAEMPADWARKGDLTVLPLSRSLLIPAVAVKMPTSAVTSAATSAVTSTTSDATSAAASAAASAATYASASAATSTFAAIYTSATSAATNAASASAATNAAADIKAASYAAFWAVLRADCTAILAGDEILHRPLWPEGPAPDELQRAWTTGRAWMQTAPGHAFWIRWYDAILAGRPLTHDWDSHWQLMHDIALIDPEDWGEGKEQGAVRVAGIIDLITQKHALQQEVAGAKKALENETFDAMSLGQHRDNLPDDMPRSRIVEYRAALAELQAELDAVEQALQPPVPDAEVLEEAAGRLQAVWEKVRKAIIALVAAYALGAAGYLGSIHMESFQSLIAEKLPGFVRSLKNAGSKPSAPPSEQSSWGNSPLDL